MSGDDTRQSERDAPSEGKPAGRKPAERDLGHALRSIYTETVREDVPADLLDLLGKLD